MQAGSLQKMTKAQVVEMREAFDMFDLDKDGHISSEELRSVMMKLNQRATIEEVAAMIRRADLDGNGTIEFNEFLLMMTAKGADHSGGQGRPPGGGSGSSTPLRGGQMSEAEFRQAFGVFDLDGDGLIDSNELRLAMRNLGVELSDADVRAMLHVADKNHDGKIDFEEFVKLMQSQL